jgi:hypothetical protein
MSERAERKPFRVPTYIAGGIFLATLMGTPALAGCVSENNPGYYNINTNVTEPVYAQLIKEFQGIPVNDVQLGSTDGGIWRVGTVRFNKSFFWEMGDLTIVTGEQFANREQESWRGVLLGSNKRQSTIRNIKVSAAAQEFDTNHLAPEDYLKQAINIGFDRLYENYVDEYINQGVTAYLYRVDKKSFEVVPNSRVIYRIPLKK